MQSSVLFKKILSVNEIEDKKQIDLLNLQAVNKDILSEFFTTNTNNPNPQIHVNKYETPIPSYTKNVYLFLGNNCLIAGVILTKLLSFIISGKVFCSAFWFNQQIFLGWFFFLSLLFPQKTIFLPTCRKKGHVSHIEEPQMLWLMDGGEIEERTTSHVGHPGLYERLSNLHS